MPKNEVAPTEDKIAFKILYVLDIYPIISPTMLQAGLGPQIPAHHWRPILEDLIIQGEIIRKSVTRKSPSGRNITYTQLTKNI